MKLDGIREKVFLDRYALKDKDGSLTEHTPEETWRRVARGIAANEKKSLQKEWEEKFYDVMSDFKFVPAGRILSGAGTGYQVTYFNCFVIPSPKDSREGILESLKQLVEIQSRSGGVGLNLSSLRPRGARVRKVNGTSSGPVTWAGLFSYATHDVVQQGGSRRGATMIMLWDWHPDIEEFITVKQDLSKINGANLSVCISDAFMEAVKKDADWDLVYPDLEDPNYDTKWNGEIDQWKAIGGKVKVYKTVKAKELWDLICTAAWRSAEPGLHFLERSNKQSNTWSFERLVATNPCVTGDTWIHTSKGPKQVKDLINTPFLARVNGKNYPSGPQGFFKTGIKQVIKLQTVEGVNLNLTEEHLIKRVIDNDLKKLKTEWCEARKLRPGDLVVLNNHRQNSHWSGEYSYKEGYVIGLLVGDGTLKSDKAVLSVWDFPIRKSQTVLYRTGTQHVMQFALESAISMPHRSDFVGWMHLPERNEHRLVLAHIKHLAHKLGMYPGNKSITSEIEKASSNFYKGFLKGLFDADGSVQLGTQGRINVRLSQSNLQCLEAVQRMLLRLGIFSRIYKNRRLTSKKILPDGKGGHKEYMTKAQHELVISRNNLDIFNKQIGFADSDKSSLLTKLLKSHSKKGRYKEYFVAIVKDLQIEAKKDVYDVKIPEVNAFDANGLIAHNCGEQPLGPWAVCNLGAMNLAAYVKGYTPDAAGAFDYESFAKDVKVAMRLLDNVIDQTYYFFKENEKCAKDIRRTGLGIMGLGDALIKMKVRYGAEESLPILEKIFTTLRDSAYEASVALAEEKGVFPKFNRTKYLQGYHIKALPKYIRKGIAEKGIRNAVLLTIAPTGTTSLVAGVSSGVEPVYEFTFKRRWRGGEEIMYHPLFDEWRKMHPNEEKPGYFCSANDLTPLDHVRVQAVAQEYIDSSISKTVNAPNSHTVSDVETLYMAAYDMGLKGVTYMRDGSRQGVLERIDDKKEDKKEIVQPAVPVTPIIPRPMMLQGVTYKTDSPIGKTYVTVNHDEKKVPFEVFITNGKSGSDVAAMADALGRMISTILRLNSPVPPRERMRRIVAELSGIGGTRSVGFGENRVRSLPDAIAKVLAKYAGFRVNGMVEDKKTLNLPTTNGVQQSLMNGHANGVAKEEKKEEVLENQLSFKTTESTNEMSISSSTTSLFDLCPECGSGTLAYEEGCKKCYSCGYSEC